MAAGDGAAQRSALAEQVLLADDLVECPRAHPGRERLAVGRRLEDGVGSSAAGAPDGHGPGRQNLMTPATLMA